MNFAFFLPSFLSVLPKAVFLGVKPLDPFVFASVVLTVLLIAAFACALPAWRAARLDATTALRCE